MSFNKQNNSFFLPSLLKNHQFQEIFYKNNKIIVYDLQQKQPIKYTRKQLSQSISRQRPQTSQTGVSISNKLQNKLVSVRNKQSIQKYIATQRKVYQQKLRPQTNNIPKRKYNKQFKQTKKVFDILEVNNQVQNTKNHGQFRQNTQVKNKKQLFEQKSDKIIKVSPQQNLISQINSKPKINPNRVHRSSIRSVNSADKNYASSLKATQKSIQQSQISNQHSLSGIKQPIIYKSKNIYPLRKSISVNSKEMQKMKNNKIRNNLSHFIDGQKRYRTVSKSPQIKKQNSQQLIQSELKSQNKTIKKSNYSLKFQFDPIDALLMPINFYQHQINLYNNINLKDKQFLSQGQQYLKHQQLKWQEKLINQNKSQKQNTINLSISRTKTQNSNQGNIQNCQSLNETQKMQQNARLLTQISKNANRLSSIQQEQDLNFLNQKNENNRKQKLLTEEIQNLDRSLQQQYSRLQIENKQSIKNRKKDKAQNVPKILKTINQRQMQFNNSPSRKMVLKSKHNDSLQIQQNYIKRADIINCINNQFYSSVKDLYWLMIKQQENTLLNRKDSKIKTKNNLQLQSLKYIKQFHKSKSFMAQQQQNLLSRQIAYQEDRIFVDRQFSHQSLSIPHVSPEEIHWIYFKPTPQTSIFPKQIRLPQHFLMIQQEKKQQKYSALINFLNCLLIINPNMISRLFQPSLKNVFSCWLHANNHFQPVYVDGYLPYDGKLNSLYAWNDEYLWIGILLKCIAKAMGGYYILEQLGLQDYSRIILGKYLQKTQKPSLQQLQTWQISQQVQQKFKNFIQKQQRRRQKVILRNNSNNQLFIIKDVYNNCIKLVQCSSRMKKLQIPIMKILKHSRFQFLLIPTANDLHYSTLMYKSYEKGNIVSFQLKVLQNKTNLTIITRLLEGNQQNQTVSKLKNKKHAKRRILVYQIPYHSGKKQNKKQMVLKYSSDNLPNKNRLKTKTNSQEYQILIHDVKKGNYKIFIECGRIKLNDYFANQQKSIKKWLKTDQFNNINDNFSSSEQFKNSEQYNFKQKVFNKQAKKINSYKNYFQIVSSQPISIKGGKSLIINQKTQQNQTLQDEQFKYVSALYRKPGQTQQY